MTKKDFIAIANTFIRCRPNSLKSNKGIQWQSMVEAMANDLHANNPRFNVGRWTSYVQGLCGPNGGSR